MNIIRCIIWAAILSALLWIVIIVTSYGILSEMDMRDLKDNNRRAYNRILEERALAERYADPSYQDYRTATHRRAK